MNEQWSEGVEVLYTTGRAEPVVTKIIRRTPTTVKIANGAVFTVPKDYEVDTLHERGVDRGSSHARDAIELATPERLAALEAKKDRERQRVAKIRAALVAFVANDLTAREVGMLYLQMRNKGMPEVE